MFTEIIERWGSYLDLAEDLGCKYQKVQKWHARNSIPASVWADLLAGARRRKIKLTATELIQAAKDKGVDK